MDFGPTADHAELQHAVRGFLAEVSDEATVRRLMDSVDGVDRDTWTRAAQQLELLSLAIPERFGGSGYGMREVGFVLEEMGRAMACTPYFATVVLCVSTLLAAGDESAAARYLPEIAAGRSTGSLADAEHRWVPGTPRGTRGRLVDGGWVLDGQKDFVLDGLSAQLLIVSADTDFGPSLFLVEPESAGQHRAPMATLDLTRKQARVQFTGTPAVLLGEVGSAESVLAEVSEIATAMLALEQVGLAAQALEMAVGYAGERVQFDAVIGSFQAIKHRCAEMFVRLELARSAAYYAAWCVDHAREELGLAAAVAGAYCSDAAFCAAAENVHIHGGMGFTWEHPAQLYFKRAKASQLMFGTPREHRESVAGYLELRSQSRAFTT